MEKVSRKIKTIFSVIFTFAGVFFLLSVAFILPVYYLSEHFPQVYSVVVICLVAVFLAILTIRNFYKCYKQYKSVHKFIKHILVLRLLPTVLIFALIISELLLIRTFFFIPLIISILLECIFNAGVIVACVYLGAFFSSVKKSLRQTENATEK
jgi:hypothetical protein